MRREMGIQKVERIRETARLNPKLNAVELGERFNVKAERIRYALALTARELESLKEKFARAHERGGARW